MPLTPDASVKAKLDWTRNEIERREQYTLTTGATITEEGQLMVRAGTAALTASVSTGPAATNIPLGVNLYGKIQGTTFTAYETGTVPAAPGPYTFQLQKTTIALNGSTALRDAVVYDTTGATYLPVAAMAVAATSVTLSAGGLITFAAGDAGHAFWVVYRYTLTTVEALDLFRQSPIGRGSDDTFSRITVAEGRCKIWTSCYDAAGQFALHTQNGTGSNDASPCTGQAGMFSTTAITTAGTGEGFPFGRVIGLPDAHGPYLGVEYGQTVYVP